MNCTVCVHICVMFSVVTVLLLPRRFGFGSVFNEKPRSRFLSVSVFSQVTQSIVAIVRVARLHPQRRGGVAAA